MRGSVYKRCPCGTTGTPGKPACKKAHGTWWWRADGGRDTSTGQRKQPGQGGYSTRDEAQEALTDHLSAVQKGTWSDDRNMTVETWLTTWLEECADRLEPKTVAGYRSHVDLILIPHLGKHRLRDLRRHHVETLIRDARTPQAAPAPASAREKVRCTGLNRHGEPCGRWANHGYDRCARHGAGEPQQGRRNGGRVVQQRAGRTLDGYRRTLRSALAAAVRRGLIAQNVAEGRIDAMPKIGRAETQWWEPDDVATFLLAVASDRLAAMYELAAFGGLRRGELLGLRWEDVDLTSATPGVNIRQTLSDLAGVHHCYVCGGQHTGRRLKPPKSEAGKRWVPLVGGTVRELIAHQASQASERSDWGEAYVDHHLVFAQEDGRPASPTGTTKRFEVLAGQLELPKIRLHDMRHGAASLLLAAGVPIEVVAMILGHASPDVVRNVYAHSLKAPTSEGMRAAMALVRDDRE